jgi:hypothetical protein
MVAAVPAAAHAAGSSLSQTGDTPETPEQLYKHAIEDARKTVAEIRKLKLPVETEPAFAFRAQ